MNLTQQTIKTLGSPPNVVNRIRRLRAQGYSVDRISKRTGVSEHKIRKATCHRYRERYQAINARRRRERAEQLLTEMPADFPGGAEKWRELVAANFGGTA